MKPITTILFDCGGVIVEDPTQATNAYFGKILGVSPEQFSAVSEPYFAAIQSEALSSQEFWKQVTAKLEVSLPVGLLKNIALEDLLGIPFAEQFTVISPTWEWVQQLKKEAQNIALLSNTIPEHVRLLQQKGILTPFEENCFLSCELQMRKPHKEIYEHVVRELAVDPEHILFIDDKTQYLQPAQELGMQTYHFTSVERAQKDLFENHDLFL